MFSWESLVDEREVGALSMDIDSLRNIVYVSQTSSIISDQAIRIFPLIVCRDSSYNLIWKKVVGEGTINAPNIFREITPEKSANGWIMIGETAKYSSINAGYGEICSWIYKINQTGDSVWSRKDTVFWSEQGTFQNYMSGVFQTPDGSIYACGYNTQFSPSIDVRATLIKVDQDGCIQNDCNTVNLEELNLRKKIMVYPNPAVDEVTFEINSSVQGKWNLIDTAGRNLKSGNWQGNSMSINVESLPTGIYFLKLQEANGLAYIGKVFLKSR